MRRRSATVVTVAAVCSVLLTGASAAATGTHAGAAARGAAAASGGTWGTAEEVPGTSALNKGGNAGIESVSCASAGNCGAGGSYTDGSGDQRAFVVGEKDGTWGTAVEVPGTAALGKGGGAAISAVSCASAGNCSAGGEYVSSSNGIYQAFVVGEANGTWGTAQEILGTAALNKGGTAGIGSVSCASAGNCSASGSYQDSSENGQAFVVGEANGTWGTAQEVPGTAALNKGNAGIDSLSCASAGNCSAGGYYQDSSENTQALVVGET